MKLSCVTKNALSLLMRTAGVFLLLSTSRALGMSSEETTSTQSSLPEYRSAIKSEVSLETADLLEIINQEEPPDYININMPTSTSNPNSAENNHAHNNIRQNIPIIERGQTVHSVNIEMQEPIQISQDIQISDNCYKTSITGLRCFSCGLCASIIVILLFFTYD